LGRVGRVVDPGDGLIGAGSELPVADFPQGG
jgi:hypothetical protein